MKYLIENIFEWKTWSKNQFNGSKTQSIEIFGQKTLLSENFSQKLKRVKYLIETQYIETFEGKLKLVKYFNYLNVSNFQLRLFWNMLVK